MTTNLGKYFVLIKTVNTDLIKTFVWLWYVNTD